MDVHLLNLTKNELLQKCNEKGILKCKNKNKNELIELITQIDTKMNNMNLNDNILLDYVSSLLKTFSLKQLAQELNVSPGTITRWIELKDVPKQYEFDLLKLSNVEINYSNYTTKEKDQFFTPVETAKKCFDIFYDLIKSYDENISDFTFIEPSAGDGSFLKVLPNDTIALDIEPRHSSILKKDYLTWKPSDMIVKYVVFGNPPFGLRGHMALKFINHSYEFAEYVCFILPQLFESDGKGSPRKRVKGYHLVHSSKLESDFYEPDGYIVKINTIFQIWSKHHMNDLYDIKDYTNEKMKIYSMSDGGTVSTTRNKNMIGKCDVYLPSTCFGKENMKCYMKFEDLPGKKGYGILFHSENKKEKKELIHKMINTEWNKIAFLSTNSAYNLRSSQIYSLFQ